ncbi:hypothetical protein C7I85_04080 [Mesorhizobium soli]|uniref:GNAT family N-acetyltransferase n=1 Tax=Pseudaminobacter soli (ex Li et al. 2025) TaxID=1295366 RepID=A0A2P7SKY0_9HYPH|nr:hypothetical protein C7I85_04080 [Mesorhizobium soli]
MSAVAELFQRILRKTRRPATHALEAYLTGLFIEAPDHDPEIGSLVHVHNDGRVTGFIGVMPLPMAVEERTVRAAVCGSLMVDNHTDDPFAGARLMRAFLSGSQDITLTETANDISTAMWRKLRATVLPDYSLEWLRVIRPAGFVAEMAANAVGAARLLSPLARPIDSLIRRGAPGPRLSCLAAAVPEGTFPSAEVDDETTAALLTKWTEAYAVRPLWQPENLRRIVAEASSKALYGEMVRRVVTTRDGRPLGLFLYHGDPGRIGRVFQILAAPGRIGEVIDSMLAHANERGMVALRGRTQPVLLEALLGRRFVFLHASSSIVHTRDPTLLEPFLAGKAFFNGFAGESWSRLIGDRFD